MKKIFFLFGMLFFSTSFAFNTDFLSYSPVFYFTTEDTTIMHAATMRALNNTPDNTRINWNNPKTGANGYIIPSRTTTKNGYTCRNLKIFNEANHVTGESSYQFCKINNEWKIAH